MNYDGIGGTDSYATNTNVLAPSRSTITLRHYVVQTSDPSAATTRLAVDELTELGFPTVWLATREPYTDRRRKTRTVEASLFPGYIFIEFDFADDAWKTIPQARGVRRILGSNPVRPVALPFGAVDVLRRKFAAGEFKIKPPAPLMSGERIVVEVGADRNTVGVVKESRGDRIKVMFEFLGMQQSWIGVDRVRRVVE